MSLFEHGSIYLTPHPVNLVFHLIRLHNENNNIQSYYPVGFGLNFDYMFFVRKYKRWTNLSLELKTSKLTTVSNECHNPTYNLWIFIFFNLIFPKFPLYWRLIYPNVRANISWIYPLCKRILFQIDKINTNNRQALSEVFAFIWTLSWTDTNNNNNNRYQ